MNNLQILAQLCREGVSVVIDGGAYLGHFTAEILEAWPAAEIHAFEPNHESCEHLFRRYQHAPNVTINRGALGEAPEIRRLNNFRAAYNDSLLRPDWRMSESMDAVLATWKGSEDCVVTRLDDYCLQAGIKEIDILKLDLQGYELPALHGAGLMLNRTRVVQAELIYVPLYEGQSDPLQVCEYLERHGFDWTITGEGVEGKWQDVFFMREE